MLADITGEGPNYHIGDEAMAEVAIERLGELFGKENLVLGCSSPEGVRKTYNIASFPFYSLTDQDLKALRRQKPLSYLKSILVNLTTLMSCRAVFVCGGGNMTSVWPGILESRLRLLAWARRLGKPVIMASQTLGPYDEAHRKRVNEILGSSAWVGVRDPSYSQTQVDFNVHYALDDANFLSPRHSPRTQALATKGRPFGCLSMRHFKGATEAELQQIASIMATWTSEKGHRTVFIPHHAPDGTEGDVKLAGSLQHHWNDNQEFIVLNPIPRASNILALTGDSQWVVTMRYHQLIFALSQQIPAVAIYSDEYTKAKLTGAFQVLGKTPYAIPLDRVTTELVPTIEAAIKDHNEQKHASIPIGTEQKESSMAPYEKLRSILHG